MKLTKTELRHLIREELQSLNEADIHPKVENKYKEYIERVKQGKDYSKQLYYFNLVLNRTYSTYRDRETVQAALEKKYGENPKLKVFRNKKK